MSREPVSQSSLIVLPFRNSRYHQFSNKTKLPNAVIMFGIVPFLTRIEIARLYVVNNCRFTRLAGAIKLQNEMEARKSANVLEMDEYEKLSGKAFSSKIIESLNASARLMGSFEALDLVRRIFGSFPNLRNICLDEQSSLATYKQFLLLGLRISYPKLEKISLSGCNLPIERLNDIAIFSLVSLNISGSRQITECLFKPSIKALNISESNINDAQLLVLSQKSPDLECLNISGCRFLTDAGLSVIASLNKLRELFVNNTRLSTQALVVIAKGCPLITKLHVCGTDVQLYPIKEMKHLQKLHLQSETLSDFDLMYVAKHPQLTNLQMDSCKRITNQGIAHLANGLKILLRSFALTNCKNITDDGFIKISEFTSLQKLKLSGEITDVSMRQILEHCPELQEVDVSLSYCNNPSFIRLFGKKCQKLKSLKIHIPHVGEEAYYRLPKCLNLETLEIHGDLVLKDGLLNHISQKCKSLREVTFVFPESSHSFVGLGYLFSRCPELRFVRVNNKVVTRAEYFTPTLFSKKISKITQFIRRPEAKFIAVAIASAIAQRIFGAQNTFTACCGAYGLYRAYRYISRLVS